MTAPGSPRGRRARNSINRPDILDAARHVVERDGLAGLSMVALSRQLGCGTMSIYGYFASKSELLTALTEHVLRDFVRQLVPPGDGPWRQEVIGYFDAYRNLMETNVAYRELVLYAPISVLSTAFTPAQLCRLDRGLGLFTGIGIALDDAVQIYNVFLNYTRSFVAFEHGMVGAVEPGDPDSTAPRQNLDTVAYPLLSQLDYIAPLFRLDANGFTLGIELLVEGVLHRYRSALRDSAEIEWNP